MRLTAQAFFSPSFRSRAKVDRVSILSSDGGPCMLYDDVYGRAYVLARRDGLDERDNAYDCRHDDSNALDDNYHSKQMPPGCSHG